MISNFSLLHNSIWNRFYCVLCVSWFKWHNGKYRNDYWHVAYTTTSTTTTTVAWTHFRLIGIKPIGSVCCYCCRCCCCRRPILYVHIVGRNRSMTHNGQWITTTWRRHLNCKTHAKMLLLWFNYQLCWCVDDDRVIRILSLSSHSLSPFLLCANILFFFCLKTDPHEDDCLS